MSRHAVLGAALLVATLTSFGRSQSVVLPPGWDAKVGNMIASLVGSGRAALPAHEQVGYAATMLKKNVYVFRSLAYRAWPYVAVPAIAQGLTVALSSGPRLPSEFSRTFRENEGADRRVVFSGVVHWPAQKAFHSIAPFNAVIKFTRPFLFMRSRARSLVLDIRVTSSSSPFKSWRTDGVWGWNRFAPTLNGSGWCRGTGGWYVRGIYTNDSILLIGGRFGPRYVGCLPNVLGVESLGTAGKGGRWGPWRLPISIPFAPGCVWATNSLVFWPIQAGPGGVCQVPPLKIPYLKQLEGVEFFDQPAFFDRTANPSGIVTGGSYKWRIAAAEHVALLVSNHERAGPRKQAFSVIAGLAPILELR